MNSRGQADRTTESAGREMEMILLRRDIKRCIWLYDILRERGARRASYSSLALERAYEVGTSRQYVEMRPSIMSIGLSPSPEEACGCETLI